MLIPCPHCGRCPACGQLPPMLQLWNMPVPQPQPWNMPVPQLWNTPIVGQRF